MVDELGNDNGHCVIDIMATILDVNKLSPSGRNIADRLDMHFVIETNNKTVSQAVVKTTNDYGIDFDGVLIFNTDNASYTKKAFRETISCLFWSCVHITCHNHIISLVAGDFKQHVSFVIEFAKCMRNLFFIPSGHKGHSLKYIHEWLCQWYPGQSYCASQSINEELVSIVVTQLCTTQSTSTSMRISSPKRFSDVVKML